MSDPLLVKADFPPAIFTPAVLDQLGDDAKIAVAARAQHNRLLGQLGGKFALTDTSVTSSPVYKWLLMRAVIVQLYRQDDVVLTDDQGKVRNIAASYTAEVDADIKGLLKDTGVLPGVPLVTAAQAEALGASGFRVLSNRRVFGRRNC